MRFPINIDRNDDTGLWSGACPNVRGVYATGDSLDDLKKNLSIKLHQQLNELIDRRVKIHTPSDVEDDDQFIELPFRAIAKLKVYEALLSRDISRTTLAELMGIKHSQVDLLLDLTQWTRTSVIENALKRLGYSVKMELVDLDTNPEFEIGDPSYAQD